MEEFKELEKKIYDLPPGDVSADCRKIQDDLRGNFISAYAELNRKSRNPSREMRMLDDIEAKCDKIRMKIKEFYSKIES